MYNDDTDLEFPMLSLDATTAASMHTETSLDRYYDLPPNLTARPHSTTSWNPNTPDGPIDPFTGAYQTLQVVRSAPGALQKASTDASISNGQSLYEHSNHKLKRKSPNPAEQTRKSPYDANCSSLEHRKHEVSSPFTNLDDQSRNQLFPRMDNWPQQRSPTRGDFIRMELRHSVERRQANISPNARHQHNPHRRSSMPATAAPSDFGAMLRFPAPVLQPNFYTSNRSAGNNSNGMTNSALLFGNSGIPVPMNTTYEYGAFPEAPHSAAAIVEQTEFNVFDFNLTNDGFDMDNDATRSFVQSLLS